MKILYSGGQKSGKTSASIEKTLKLATNKPYYLATYDNSYNDNEMQERVNKHQDERCKDFYTIEETKYLTKVIKDNETYLIDCLSMWILNRINEEESVLIEELKQLFSKDSNIIFVLNSVNSGVIPMDSLSRRFVDLTGIVGQYIAKHCDEVYIVELGIRRQIK